MKIVDKEIIRGDKVQGAIRMKRGDIGDYVLLPGDPARSNRAAKFFDDPVLVAEHREYRSFTGTYKGVKVSVTSTGMGCPSAAFGVEELINIGAKVLIRIGSSAAIQEGIKIGDLIVSTGAMKNEGTSKFFVPDSFPAVPDLEVTKLLLDTAKKLSGVPVHHGIGSTDDAFYGETPEYIAERHRIGCTNLEMEASAIFTVAHRRKVRAAAIYGVSANLVTHEIPYGDGEGEMDRSKLENAWDEEIKIALETIYQLDQMAKNGEIVL